LKLASLREGRDGRLVVVSRDLSRFLPASGISGTLQEALDDWRRAEPGLRRLFMRLEAGEGDALDLSACDAPLPRAYQWADGSAYLNHVELVRRARGAQTPETFLTDPLMYQGGSDAFLGPSDPILMDSEDWGVDFEAEIAVITGDLPQSANEAEAAGAIRLFTLVNDVSLRSLVPAELAKGFGFLQSKPASAFAPVAVTPDELGSAWDGRRLSGELRVFLNGRLFGRTDPGVDMTFGFPALIAHLCRTRRICAGTIVGSGTVSNRDPGGGPGAPVSEGGLGYSCIAEQRSVETLRGGAAYTPFLRFGDRVRIEMASGGQPNVFGAIEQLFLRRNEA